MMALSCPVPVMFQAPRNGLACSADGAETRHAARATAASDRTRIVAILPPPRHTMTRQSEDVMQIIQDREQFDVCVVGSGAGGGMAARVLTEAGARVLMLECGVDWDPVKDSFMFQWPYDTPRRGAATPAQQFGEFDAGLGGWTIEGER